MSIEDFDKALDDDQTFKILREDGWTLEHSAGCSGREDGSTKEYRGYLIEFADGVFDDCCGSTLAHLYVKSNRHVETDVWQDVTSSRECPPAATATNPSGTEFEQEVLKLAFRPHRG